MSDTEPKKDSLTPKVSVFRKRGNKKCPKCGDWMVFREWDDKMKKRIDEWYCMMCAANELSKPIGQLEMTWKLMKLFAIAWVIAMIFAYIYDFFSG